MRASPANLSRLRLPKYSFLSEIETLSGPVSFYFHKCKYTYYIHIYAHNYILIHTHDISTVTEAMKID